MLAITNLVKVKVIYYTPFRRFSNLNLPHFVSHTLLEQGIGPNAFN